MLRLFSIILIGAILWGCSSTTLSEDPFACEFLKYPPSKELVIPEGEKWVILFVDPQKIIDSKGPNARAITFNINGTLIIWLPAGKVSRELMCLAWHEAQHAVPGGMGWHP